MYGHCTDTASHRGISGTVTLPTILAAGATGLASTWRGLIQLGHPSTLHRPTDGQFQFLKGAEEDQVLMDIIRAVSVIWILRGEHTNSLPRGHLGEPPQCSKGKEG